MVRSLRRHCGESADMCACCQQLDPFVFVFWTRTVSGMPLITVRVGSTSPEDTVLVPQSPAYLLDDVCFGVLGRDMTCVVGLF